MTAKEIKGVKKKKEPTVGFCAACNLETSVTPLKDGWRCNALLDNLLYKGLSGFPCDKEYNAALKEFRKLQNHILTLEKLIRRKTKGKP